MNNYLIKAGTADVSVVIRIIDSTDGTPETGVVFNTAGIDLEYRREGAVSVDITEATLADLTTVHTDGGFLHIGNGYYRLDLPDAACVAGSTGVLIHGTVTGMVVIGAYIQLVAYDPFDTVRLGLTALPNAVAAASGGLIINGSNTGTVTLAALVVTGTTTFTGAITASAGIIANAITGTLATVTTLTNLPAITTDWLTAAGVSAGAVTKIQAGLATPTNITAGTITTVTNVTNLSSGAIIAASITDGAITNAKFGAAAISYDKLADDAIRPAKIQDGAFTAAKFAANSITASALATDAVTEIADGQSVAYGTARATLSTSTRIQLAAGESGTDDLYNGCIVHIVSGTGVGQCRLIVDYDGTNKLAYVDVPFVVTPNATSLYRIYPFNGVLLIDSGLATAAAASTITLATSAPAVADILIGHTVVITGGVGIGQARIITAYTAGRIATVSPAWTTQPDTTSTYKVIPIGRVFVNAIADAVIANATFAADVGTTAIATNVIGIAAKKGVVDALNVDTYAEPGQETPASTNTLVKKIGYLFKAWRNKLTQTATQYNLFNDDAATVDQKAACTDDATTYTKGEVATGP